MAATPRSSSLGPDDWADAALAVLRTRGPSAVKVESLARDLKTTKGSFYWHFDDRRALIRAAMQRWLAEGTMAIIDVVEGARGPEEILRRLMHLTVAHRDADHAELGLYVGADDPDVGAGVTEVTERRIAFVGDLLARAGHPPDVARQRAVVLYAAVLGLGQLVIGDPRQVPNNQTAQASLADTMVDMALAPQPTKPRPRA